MKRTVIVFISLLFILSACGGKESKENKENTTASTIAESEVAAFVGEGQMTVLRTLINSNEFFVNFPLTNGFSKFNMDGNYISCVDVN